MPAPIVDADLVDRRRRHRSRATAARTASAQGVSTAMRAGTPQARERGRQQGGADRAVGLGRRDVVARHEEAGDQADAGRAGQRLARLRQARRGSRRSGPAVSRPTSRQTSASMAAMRGITFPWRHTLPSNRAANRRSGRRPARASSRSSPGASRAPRRGGLAAVDQAAAPRRSRRSGRAPGRPPAARPARDRPASAPRQRHPAAHGSRSGSVLPFTMTRSSSSVAIVGHLPARLVADDDADAVGLALPFEPRGEVHVVAQAGIGEALRRSRSCRPTPGPVLRPMPMFTGMCWRPSASASAFHSSLSSTRCACMASAVSQARAAWRSTSSGAFQNAMIASPMYLSIVPRWLPGSGRSSA